MFMQPCNREREQRSCMHSRAQLRRRFTYRGECAKIQLSAIFYISLLFHVYHTLFQSFLIFNGFVSFEYIYILIMYKKKNTKRNRENVSLLKKRKKKKSLQYLNNIPEGRVFLKWKEI